MPNGKTNSKLFISFKLYWEWIEMVLLQVFGKKGAFRRRCVYDTVGIQIDAFDAAQTQDSTTRLTCLYPPIYTLHVYQ